MSLKVSRFNGGKPQKPTFRVRSDSDEELLPVYVAFDGNPLFEAWRDALNAQHAYLRGLTSGEIAADDGTLAYYNILRERAEAAHDEFVRKYDAVP